MQKRVASPLQAAGTAASTTTMTMTPLRANQGDQGSRTKTTAEQRAVINQMSCCGEDAFLKERIPIAWQPSDRTANPPRWKFRGMNGAAAAQRENIAGPTTTRNRLILHRRGWRVAFISREIPVVTIGLRYTCVSAAMRAILFICGGRDSPRAQGAEGKARRIST